MEAKKIVLPSGIVETEEMKKWIELLLDLNESGVTKITLLAPYEIYDQFIAKVECLKTTPATGCLLMAQFEIGGRDNNGSHESLNIQVSFRGGNKAIFFFTFDYSDAIDKIIKRRESENKAAKKATGLFKRFKPLIYERTPEEEFLENEDKMAGDNLCFRIKRFFISLNSSTGIENKSETTWTEAYKIIKAISAGRFHRAVEIPKTERRAEY